MKNFSKILLMVLCFMAIGTAAFAQVVATEAIGPLTGNLTVNFPPDPCATDTVSFGGSVHVVTQVDTSLNTMDVHINLMTVKGTGSNGKYIGNGAESFLSIPPGPADHTISFSANLYPPDPCRAGFTTQGALPITVTFNLGTDNTLNQVSAVVGTPGT